VLWRQGADLVVRCNCDIQVLANQAVALHGKTESWGDRYSKILVYSLGVILA